MKHLKLAVIALFVLFSINTTNAQDENNNWAISLGVNAIDFYHPGANLGDALKDHYGTSDWNVLAPLSIVTVEKYLDKGFSLQFAGSANQITHQNVSGDVDEFYFSLGANVKYDVNKLVGETGWFDPFIFLGGRYANFDSNGEGMFSYGYGFNVWINDNLGVTYQTGSNLNFANKVQNHAQSSLGLVVKFGGTDTDGDGIYDKKDACPEVPGLPEFNGCPDSDGDGIKDSEDSCPNVAGLAEMNGCPDSDGDGVADKDDMCPNEAGTKANKGCPDSDGDGLVDKDDNCPNVAGDSANKGCPWPDTDGDGVLDKDDKCANEAGVSSNNGCPEDPMSPEQIKMLEEYSEQVSFAVDRANINKSSAETLDKVYDLINPVEKVTFVIEGYADSTGGDEYNQYLSERRAEAVKAYLVKKGIDEAILETKGYGESNPVATNDTRAGRAQNRRIVIKLNEM